jgi:hypothetical protein
MTERRDTNTSDQLCAFLNVPNEPDRVNGSNVSGASFH